MSEEELRTVYWDAERKHVVLLDQTKLPAKLIYVRCSRYQQVADAIRTMVVRGAPAIGVAAAMGLALCAARSKASEKAEFLRELEKAGEVLGKTRPTAVNLFWAIARVTKMARDASDTVEAAKEAVIQEALKMAEEDLEVNRTMGRLGASLLEDGDSVLTHCN